MTEFDQPIRSLRLTVSPVPLRRHVLVHEIAKPDKAG
jgi:hypothetical protein